VSSASRAAELETIGSMLEGAGRGLAAIEISGEPGIGKSVLWQEGAALAAARGYLVLACAPGRCETGLSFSGLACLLGAVPARVLAGLPGPQRAALETVLLTQTSPGSRASFRAVCMAAVSTVTALSEEQPVLIAVDDVQWLDTPTARVLGFMFRRLSRQPVTALMGTRQEEPDDLPLGLGQVAENRRTLRIWLGPLGENALCQAVRAHSGVVLSKPVLSRVHQACGGNPRLGIQIVAELRRRERALAAGEPVPLPASLRSLTARRMRRLSGEDRTAVLAAAAQLRPTIGQVRAAMGWRDGTLLDGAEQNGFVEVCDGRVCFKRPFLPAVVYSAASAVERRHVHARLAEAGGEPGEQAWHAALAMAEPDAEVAGSLEKAGRAAQAQGAVQQAASLWELAARRTPADDPGGRQRRSLAAGVCLFIAGDSRRARSLIEDAAGGMTAGRSRAWARLWLATIAYCDASPAEAVESCLRGLAETETDDVLRASLYLRASWFMDHDTQRRLQYAQAAAEILGGGAICARQEMLTCAQAVQNYYRFLAGQGCGCQGCAGQGCGRQGSGRRDCTGRACTGQDCTGRACTGRACPGPSADCPDAGPPRGDGHCSWEAAWSHFTLAVWAKCHDPAGAREELGVLYRQVAEMGGECAKPVILTHLAEVECWLGDWERAGTHVSEALEIAGQTGQRRMANLALSVRARLEACTGRTAAAREQAERGLALATASGDAWAATAHLAVLGFAALAERQPVLAAGYLSRADEFVSSMGLAEPAGHRFHADYVEAVAGSGDLVRAAALAERLAERAGSTPYPWLLAASARARAIVQAATGELDAAIASVEEALLVHQHARLPFERARTLLVAGQIRRRRKEKLLAREMLLAARAIFDGLGAPGWSARSGQELARLGLRRSLWCDLTPSEEAIARMVANGLTNREVASALFISHKTVEANLSRIFRKLGIRSRRELSAAPGLFAP
jgi:DNA-binding CsgD family transcriptional regulator/tetratricopeptide (TPR) repeat protein